MPTASTAHARRSTSLANWLFLAECDARRDTLDEQIAQAALVAFANRLKAKRVTRVELDRIRWTEDGAEVQLMDGAALLVEVREFDKQLAPSVELVHVHRLGAVISLGRVAEQWLDAHERVLVDSWSDHCAAEK